MAIVEQDLAAVRAAANLVDIAGEHMALRRVGRRWVGLCPFHAEKSPSFSVNAEEGLYYCFGCQAKGDVITFVREVEHVDFVEAVERLAGRCGIELHYDNTVVAAERKRRSVLVAAMEQAVQWYHERLLHAPDASAARAYLRERGYDGEVVRRYRLGWAPDAWDELSRALRLPSDVLRDTGLGFVNSRNRTQDAFRGRVLFPIFDPSDAPVAFGGRLLPAGVGPKYKNSSETLLYAKSRTLYGLNWGKAEIVRSNEVIVCEGYTDVIGFAQAGIARAVATCGTALTEEHVRLLKNFAPRVVLAYDADAAGQAAAERFYAWERKLGIDIVVAVLPKGTDPADAARKDPGLLRNAVENAQPFLGFRVDRVLRSHNLHTPEGKAKAAEQACTMIAEHPDPLIREQYLMTVADHIRVPMERLAQLVAQGPASGPASGGAAAGEGRRVIDLRSDRSGGSGQSGGRSGGSGQRRHGGGAGGGDSIPESELAMLRLAVGQPTEVRHAIDDLLLERETEFGIEEILFVNEVARGAFRALAESPTLFDAIAAAPPEASELLSRLAVEEAEGTPIDELLRLVDQAANREIRELQVDARVTVGTTRYNTVVTAVAWLKLSIERLRSPETALEAAVDIAAWLLERAEAGERAGERDEAEAGEPVP